MSSTTGFLVKSRGGIPRFMMRLVSRVSVAMLAVLMLSSLALPVTAGGLSVLDGTAIPQNELNARQLARNILLIGDITPPSVEISAPTESEVLHNLTVRVEWSVNDTGSGINHTFLRVDSGNWLSVDGLSSFEAILLNGGHHNVTLVALDVAGNQARDVVEFSVQVAPDAPESVNATAGASGIGISWAEPFDGGSLMLSYKVFRSVVSGTYDSTPLAITSIGMHVDSGAVAGTKYFYVVRASNSQGDGPASAEVNATLADGSRPPDAPTGLKSTPGTGFVSLSWSPPSDQGAGAVIAYQVYRTSVHGANPEIPIATLNNGQLHFIDSSLVSGTYYYKVSAVNFAEGPRSNESEAVVDGIEPGSPGTIVSMSLIEEQSSIRLSWSASPEGASPIFRYLIYRSPTPFDPVFLDSTSSMSYEDENVTGGQTYYYWIVAENEQGQGPLSAVMTGALLDQEPGIGVEVLAPIFIILAMASLGFILYRRRRR